MEAKNEQAIRADVIVASDIDEGKLREPTEAEVGTLLSDDFKQGRIVDQRRREGRSRDFWYLVYREPDGRIYALIATDIDGRFRIVIPEVPIARQHPYLWDYSWTN